MQKNSLGSELMSIDSSTVPREPTRISAITASSSG